MTAKRNDKNRAIAVTEVLTSWTPQYDSDTDTFNSGMPQCKMYTSSVIDEPSGEMMRDKSALTINFQQQIDAGVLTIEEVTTGIAMFRKAMYNQIDLNNSEQEQPA